MKVIKAKTAGFCFGVKRAVDTVYEQVEKCGGKNIYTYGPIIHNEEVVKDMGQKGVTVLRSEEELDALEEGIVIIRSHGVEKRIYDKLNARGIGIVDATCPFVKKIHNIVSEQSAQGKYIVIIGNPEHPEVQGIRGWAGERVCVIQNSDDAEKFSPDENEKIYHKPAVHDAGIHRLSRHQAGEPVFRSRCHHDSGHGQGTSGYGIQFHSTLSDGVFGVGR